MYIVYKHASTVRREVAEFETEEEAIEFCEAWNWEMMDENTFVWDLYYDEY